MRKLLPLLLLIPILFHHCGQIRSVQKEELDLKIKLRWVKAYNNENSEKITTGLTWALSYLGADLPKGCMEAGMDWKTDALFELDIEQMGFSDNAEQTWHVLLEKMRESEEYKKMDGIDLGRFIMLTLNSSNHYYALTEIPKTLKNFKANKTFQETPLGLLKGESGVSRGERVVFSSEMRQDNSIEKLGFFAFEGTGSILEEGIEPEEFEVIDIMENGQIRLGLYDKNGKLKMAANAELSFAGKPAKCIWCHERIFQPIFSKPVEKDLYQSTQSFQKDIQFSNKILDNYRKTKLTDIDYFDFQAHTQTELLYISFQEPSAFRLANEWNITVPEVKELLKDLEVHDHHEFKFLKSLYNRSEVESVAPYKGLKTPDDPRELSTYEPNYLK